MTKYWICFILFRLFENEKKEDCPDANNPHGSCKHERVGDVCRTHTRRTSRTEETSGMKVADVFFPKSEEKAVIEELQDIGVPVCCSAVRELKGGTYAVIRGLSVPDERVPAIQKLNVRGVTVSCRNGNRTDCRN